MVFVLYLNQNTIINNNLKSSTQEMNMQKNGEEYELFVQDIYKILNCADGLTNEDRITVKQLIDKLPSDEEGRDRRYLFEFDNAYLEYEDEYIKIDKIEFTYDVEFSYDTQHISMMNMARAIVNNVITGESFLIDITGNVKNWWKAEK